MLGRKFCRGLVVQCAMWPMLVVVSAPSGDQDTSLRQARKPVVVQTLIPETTVEALDERVLGGFACLNQLELNAMLAGPLVEGLAGKFRPLISPNSLWVASEASRLIEDACHVMSGNPEVDREIDGLLAEIIDDGQHLDPSTIRQGITDEVH